MLTEMAWCSSYERSTIGRLDAEQDATRARTRPSATILTQVAMGIQRSLK